MENENAKIETQIQIPVNGKNNEIKVGRKPKLTKEALLEFIAKYQTTSPYELSKLLTEKEDYEISYRTIYRMLNQIPQAEIDAVFKELAEEQLKPHEMQKDVFLNLPEMEEYIKTLRSQKLQRKYFSRCVNGLWRFCTIFNIRPKALTVEKLPKIRDWIQQVEDGKIECPYKTEMFIRGLRSWYLYAIGISKEKINKYIPPIMPLSVGKYAREKIPIEKREAFVLKLKEYCIEKGIIDKYPIYLSLVYWLFYTGTRIEASLNVNIEDIKEYENYSIAKVVDKGRHKLGRQKWDKIITGELKKAIEYNLQSRGNPKEGKLFPISPEDVRTTFKTIYKRLDLKYKSPAHIWRHTSAQELLDATGWNYDLVASILGWKDTRTLKACYGEMGDEVKLETLYRAMGLPIKKELKKFQFAEKPIESFFLSL